MKQKYITILGAVITTGTAMGQDVLTVKSGGENIPLQLSNEPTMTIGDEIIVSDGTTTKKFPNTQRVTLVSPVTKALYAISAAADKTLGSVTISAAEAVEEGTEVTVTATPAEGYEFVNWTIDGKEVSTDATYTFTAKADAVLTANFKAKAPAIADVRISYMCNGTELKSETVSAKVGEKIEISAEQKATFYNDDKTKKFIYVSDNAAATTVGSEGTVVTITLREAGTFSYTIRSSQGGVVAQGTGMEGEKVDAGYPRYQLVDGVLYEAPKTNNSKKEYRVTIDLANDNAEQTITYSKVKDNIAFYAEAEDMESLTKVTYGNVAVRASNALAAKADQNTVITTLPAGKYKVAAGVFSSAKTPAYEIKIAIGEDVYAAPVTAVNASEVMSDEYNVAEGTAVTLMAEGMGNNNALDYLYIIKTGEYEAPAPPVNKYTISAAADKAQGSVTISAAEAVEEGTEVTVSATPAEGYEFVNWTIDGKEVSTDATYTFTAKADAVLTANFKAKVPAAVVYPIDMTDKMVNAECAGVQGTAGADGWTITGNGNPPYRYGNFFENWNATPANAKFDYYQEVNNLPAGKYIVSAEIQYDAAAGDNENGIYAATAADEVHGGTKAGATGFVEYSTPEILVTDGTLRIGIKTFATQSQSWTAARNFKLTMVGEVSLDEFEKKLTDLLATAKTDAKEPMNAEQSKALDKVIKDYDGKKLTSISEYETALAAANKAVSEAETSIANYKEALDLLKVGETFDEKGKDIFYTTSSISELLYAVNERLFVSLASYDVNLIKFEIGEAAKTQGVGADMTAAMPARWTGATGNYAGRQERYYDAAAGSPVDADVMTQTISGLKPGEYEVTFEAAVNYTDGRGIDGHAASKEDNVTVVFAQDVKESVEVVSQTACTVFPQYTLRAFVGDDGKLTYGIHNNDKGANWFVAAAVKLVYLNANKPTAVDSIKAEMQRVGAVKVVRNGVIYILTGGKEINASGARMK